MKEHDKIAWKYLHTLIHVIRNKSSTLSQIIQGGVSEIYTVFVIGD